MPCGIGDMEDTFIPHPQRDTRVFTRPNASTHDYESSLTVPSPLGIDVCVYTVSNRSASLCMSAQEDRNVDTCANLLERTLRSNMQNPSAREIHANILVFGFSYRDPIPSNSGSHS